MSKLIEESNDRLKSASDNLAIGESELRKAEQGERDAERRASESREKRARADAVSEASAIQVSAASDRIREDLSWKQEADFKSEINGALNSTLSRTINTSMTTLVVLLIIFVFGGAAIKGFIFALIIGILVGTYSSMFVATPLLVDLTKKIQIKKS